MEIFLKELILTLPVCEEKSIQQIKIDLEIDLENMNMNIDKLMNQWMNEDEAAKQPKKVQRPFFLQLKIR